jgi:hypothetical protein
MFLTWVFIGHFGDSTVFELTPRDKIRMRLGVDEVRRSQNLKRREP